MNYKFKPTENKVTTTTLFGVGFLLLWKTKIILLTIIVVG